jgi:hypothetical protein
MILVGCKLNSAEGAVGMFIILKLIVMIYFVVFWKPVIKLKQFQQSIECYFLCGLVTRLCRLVTKEVTCVVLEFVLMAVIQKPSRCTCICSLGVRSASHFGDFISGE